MSVEPLASAPAAAAGLPPAAGAPEELIQLLTPEGERVRHPDYPLDLTAEEIQGLYRERQPDGSSRIYTYVTS